jgi:methionyl-tRNA formyltransferase
MTTHAPVRIVFMGTPDFAVPVLRALHKAAPAHHWQIVATATQPDRPAGRGKQLAASPVKVAALELGLPVVQPATLRKPPDGPHAVEALRALAPDLLVVAAYGLILPRSVLELPTFGCINVHASLLPQYRGASPITAAILDGLLETGISIMLMDEGMDTGPVLAQARLPITPDDTTASLSKRLSELGASLLLETLPRWLAGEVAPIAQTELPGEPSAVRLLKKEAGRIDWSLPAARIERMTRAYTPWPGAYTTWRSEPFRIHSANALPGRGEPGKVVRVAEGVAVGAGDGLLLLKTVQPAGKRPLPIQEFLNGAPAFVGVTLGVPAQTA